MFDRDTLFAHLRKAPFGRFTQSQVDGINAILDGHARVADRTSLPQLAYCFATAHWETGAAMQPVTENLTYTTAERIRAVWPSRFPTIASAKPYVRNPRALANKVYGGRMGNTGPDDGWLYRGRTLVQLTGKDNYERATKKLQELGFDVDLVKNPDDANRPDIAPVILFLGMEEGWFTGYTLDRAIDDVVDGDELADFIVGRKIINGTDKAKEIANLAMLYLAALIAARNAFKSRPEDAGSASLPFANERATACST